MPALCNDNRFNGECVRDFHHMVMVAMVSMLSMVYRNEREDNDNVGSWKEARTEFKLNQSKDVNLFVPKILIRHHFYVFNKRRNFAPCACPFNIGVLFPCISFSFSAAFSVEVKLGIWVLTVIHCFLNKIENEKSWRNHDLGYSESLKSRRLLSALHQY